MEAGAPTHDCLADLAGSANATLGDVSSLLPFDASCPPPTLVGALGSAGGGIMSQLGRLRQAVQSMQQTVESMDLSLTLPNHPPIGPLGPNALGGTYGVSFPDVPTWISLQLGVSAALLCGVAFSAILYHALLKRERTASASRRAAVGVPLFLASVLLPYRLIAAVETVAGFQNTTVRFASSIPFVLYQFRILEAALGFVPSGASTNGWTTYGAYFALPFDMKFDEETERPALATKRDLWNGMLNLGRCLACMVALCSVLSPFGYQPFGDVAPGDWREGGVTAGEYLNPRHLGNCFAIAVFFQQALALGDAAFGTAIQAFLGYRVERSMRNPMLEATSPSDFWGRRWNVLVHSVMKRGAYKPVRKVASSAALASLAVFLASGLFHEWLVHVVFLRDRPPSSRRGVALGSNAAFFLWNFVVIACEKALVRTRGVRSLGRRMPSAIVPFAIIMTSLPVAHWFGNPYSKGGFMDDYERCLFLIRKV